jgi:hypothetical protein
MKDRAYLSPWEWCLFNPLKPEPPSCPVCRRQLFIVAGHGVLRCALCESELCIPIAYPQLLWLLIVTILGAIGIATYSSAHAGTWLLCLIISSIPLRIALGKTIPPWFNAGRQQFRFTFLLWYFGFALSLPLYRLAEGWFHVLTGNSKDELSEFLITSSWPLDWISSDFLLDSNKTFLDACGTVLGNSFFYAVATFAGWRFVRAILKRSRVTAMNLDSRPDPEEEEL